MQNTGQRWNRAGTELASWGTAPTMVEPVQGTIILSKLQAAQEVRVQAIDGAGQPLGSPVLADKSGEDWKFVAGQTATTWYLITVVR